MDDSAWQDFPKEVTASNTTGVAVDGTPPASGTRFYRVLLAP